MVNGTREADDLPLRISVLGAFLVRRDGLWSPAPTRQVARVGTVLAGWPGETVERERIMAAVWGEKPPTTATNTLQVHVSHLRRLVGRDAVKSDGTGYSIEVPPEAIDAEQFVETVHEAARMRRRQHFARAAELLTEGLALWRGTPFPDIADPDLEARRARLSELRDQAREDLLECRLELATDAFDLGDVIAEAKELVSRQPQREKGHVLLVRALAAADRGGEASQAFEDAQARARQTMGLDPGRALVHMHHLALQQDAAIYPVAMRAVNVVSITKRNDDACAELAARVRSAVVDLGATVVTAICDEKHAASAAATVARTLAPDMASGVVVLEGAHATLAGLNAALETATGDQVDVRTWDKTPHLGIVVVAPRATARKLVTALQVLDEPPAVVTVGPKPLDCDSEAVIAGNVQPVPDRARRGA
jgi:DNA-binding SARP family transcriptional activator